MPTVFCRVELFNLPNTRMTAQAVHTRDPWAGVPCRHSRVFDFLCKLRNHQANCVLTCQLLPFMTGLTPCRQALPAAQPAAECCAKVEKTKCPNLVVLLCPSTDVVLCRDKLRAAQPAAEVEMTNLLNFNRAVLSFDCCDVCRRASCGPTCC